MASNSGSTTPQITNAGIITDAETGQRHIPSSVRPDGSKRKEIKIRPGYRPAEDVEVYKNRTAHAFQTRGTGGVPGAEGLKDDSSNTQEGGKLNKNAKRREARKKAKAEGATETVDGEDSIAANEAALEAKDNSTPKSVLSKDEEERLEKDKKARKLKKKLREAKDLQEKKAKGEKLLQEQFEKVIKINELIRDLDKLGFDANGEPKQTASSE